jgi:hypothetical protein
VPAVLSAGVCQSADGQNHPLANEFLAWCEAHDVRSLAEVQSLHVATWIEEQTLIGYEVWMLGEAFKMVGPQETPVRNVITESRVLHARNLCDLLCIPRKARDDLRLGGLV